MVRMRISLRFRIVVTFIGIVIVSLILSFFLFMQLSEKSDTPNQLYISIAEDVAKVISLIDDPGKVNTFGDFLNRFKINIATVNEPSDTAFSLDKATLAPLFDTRSTDAVFLSGEGGIAIVGIPKVDENKGALIVKIDFSLIAKGIRLSLIITLLSVLIIGSLLILFMSRYIVKPIKKLTAAAKEMASGNLSVRLKYRNKDEFGELMGSFNLMASELQKMDSVRDDFVSNVSHEMQSPLTSIRGFTRALQDGVIPPEEQKEHLDIIYEETLRLSRLSDNLLRLASLDSEHHPVNLTTYKLDEQLRRTIVLAEPQWSRKDINIELELFPCEITVDKDLFDQVWQNLINNAIKYSGQESSIHVEIKLTEQFVEVYIKDSGKGIPEEALPLIFDRFYMVEKARSSSLKGNGLGLSIVMKILKIHDCSIDVKSKVGEGTEFIITIPRYNSPN